MLPTITIDDQEVVTSVPVGNLPASADEMLPILEKSFNETFHVVESFHQVTGAVLNRQSQYLLRYKNAVETDRALKRDAEAKLTEDNRRLNEEKREIERQLEAGREKEEDLNESLEVLRKSKDDAEAETSRKLKRTYDNMCHLHESCEKASQLVNEGLSDVNRDVKAKHSCLIEEMEDRVKSIAKVLSDPNKYGHQQLPAVSSDVPDLNLKDVDLGKA